MSNKTFNKTMKNQGNDANNFIKSLSKQRFNRYMVMAGHHQEKALTLYTLNSRISESLYIPLQGLEVCLRNNIDDVLQVSFGDFWFDRPNLLKTGYQLEDIAFVKARILKEKRKEESPLSHGRIIAGQSFGFWTSMFNSEYETMWQQILHNIVIGNKSGINRKTFSGPLKAIRDVRNRIAHHECILEYALKDHYKNIMNLVNLLNPDKAKWIEQNSRFYQIYGEVKDE